VDALRGGKSDLFGRSLNTQMTTSMTTTNSSTKRKQISTLDLEKLNRIKSDLKFNFSRQVDRLKQKVSTKRPIEPLFLRRRTSSSSRAELEVYGDDWSTDGVEEQESEEEFDEPKEPPPLSKYGMCRLVNPKCSQMFASLLFIV
jgi:hypothetical protein